MHYVRFDTPMPGNAIQMNSIDRTQWTRCPGLGANNREMLQAWPNIDDSRVDWLTENKITFDSPPV